MTDPVARAPQVSIILPAHNRALLTCRAIESVLAQTHRDFELIVVDDASSDDTFGAVTPYMQDPRVKLIRNEVNRGPSGARNVGIEAATAALIAFQDSDDVWLPGKLAAQITTMARHPDVGVCYCAAIYYSAELCYAIPIAGRAKWLEGDLSHEILRSNPTTPQTLLIRRHLLDQAGIFDEALKMNVDWDLTIRLAQTARFAFVPEPLVIIYRTEDSVSSDRLKDAYCREQLMAKYSDLFERDRPALGLQHYITGSYFRRFGRHRDAYRHFKSAVRTAPTPRGVAKLVLSGLQIPFAREPSSRTPTPHASASADR